VSPDRLPRHAVLRHLERIADDLTPRNLDRLRKLTELIDGEGRIPLGPALDIATTGRDDQARQTAFRQFRATVKKAAADASVELELTSDGRTSAVADRFCWFAGEDTAVAELAALSEQGATLSGSRT
jgi:hypothetical protein